MRLIVMLPGVPGEPDSVSHGTDEVNEKFSACLMLVDVTLTVTGVGAAVVPAVIAKLAPEEESTKVVVLGPTVMLDAREDVAAGVEESVTTTEKLAVPAVVGVPEICPPANVRPAGREPVIEKV